MLDRELDTVGDDIAVNGAADASANTASDAHVNSGYDIADASIDSASDVRAVTVREDMESGS